MDGGAAGAPDAGEPRAPARRAGARRAGGEAPHRFFLAASLLFGAALGAVTPPFHVPDEQAHFYRAYRVAEGRLDLVPAPGAHSRVLPRSLFELAGLALGGVRFQPLHRIPEGTLDRLARVRLEPERRVPVLFPQTLQYTFVPYVVPAVAIALGRLAGAEPLALLYLARGANLVFGTLAVVAAIRLLPAMRWWLVALASTPMAVALRASVSADVLAMSAAVVLVASAWRIVAGPGRARPGHLALAGAAAFLLCAARPPYAPLALLPLLASPARLPRVRPWLWRLAHVALVAGGTAWGFLTAMRVGFTRPGTGIDPALQLRFALANPLTVLEAAIVDYGAHAARYLGELVGKLGWLDTVLPAPLLVGYLLLLLALLLVDGEPAVAVSSRQRVAVLALLAATLAGISASQYLVWTPVGSARIPDGIQGRYFLPAALALAWLGHRAPRGDLAWRRWMPWLMSAVLVLVAAVTLWTVWQRYYG